MWWEGRAFKPGKFNTADECATYCNDGSWPVQKTCSSGSCNEHCAQCVASNTWAFPEGAVCHLVDVQQQDCLALFGYEWDWNAKLCYRKNFYGSEADCIDLDSPGDGGYDGSFSMSMSMVLDAGSDGVFDFYGDEVGSTKLTHQYVSCPAQSESTCAAYCWAKDHDMQACHEAGLEWDWSLARCKHSIWTVNKRSSPSCESYVAGLGADASEAERWERAEQCWHNGCHFDVGHAGYTAPTCTGQSKGCEEQAGETEWVDGGDEHRWRARFCWDAAGIFGAPVRRRTLASTPESVRTGFWAMLEEGAWFPLSQMIGATERAVTR